MCPFANQTCMLDGHTDTLIPSNAGLTVAGESLVLLDSHSLTQVNEFSSSLI